MSTTPQKICECSFCGLTFGTNSEHQLKNHIKIQHLEKHCIFCGQSFSYQSHLKAHISAVHLRYTCNYCGKSYSRKYSGLKSEEKNQQIIFEMNLYVRKKFCSLQNFSNFSPLCKVLKAITVVLVRNQEMFIMRIKHFLASTVTKNL